MIMSKVLLFIIVAASFILSGCATTKSSELLNNIKVDKLQLNNKPIQISSSSEFIAFIDREDLSMMVQAKIVSVLQKIERVGGFSSNTKTLHTFHQTSEIELNSKNYVVDRQEHLDGYWYLALRYIE